MFERIIVPLDGTEQAERAVPVAARIALATGGTLIFVSVALPEYEYGAYAASRAVVPHPESSEAALERASMYLHEVLHRYAKELAGIETAMEVTSGTAALSIFKEADEQHADLIVLCSQGETGFKRWVLGSVAQQAVRHSPVPVLVLNAHGAFPPFSDKEHPLRVLLPLDGSSLSEEALEPTIRFIAALVGPAQAALHLVRVIDMPLPYSKARAYSHVDKMMQEEEEQKARDYLHDLMDRILIHVPAGLQLTVTSSIIVSMDVTKAICAEAEPDQEEQQAEPYDLVALATHGRGGLQRLLMGSVTEHLLGTIKVPMLIVRPHEQVGQGVREERIEVTQENFA